MKRFLIFQSGYGGSDAEATELYIGEFDAAEDIVHDVPKLRKATRAIDELNIQILDTSEGLWYTYRLFPLMPDHNNGKFRRQYDEYMASLRALTKKVPPPCAVRRFVLYGITEHERAGPTDDLLNSFDSTQELVDALAKFIEEAKNTGYVFTFLTPRWHRLKDTYKWLQVLDLQTDTTLIIKWEVYDRELDTHGYGTDYRKFLEFDQHAKRTMAE